MRRPIVHGLVIACVLISLGAGACRGRGRAGSADAGGQSLPVPAEPAVAADRLVLSAARERAIAVIETLATHPDAQVRANAVEAASLTATRMLPVIEAGLGDPSAGVRSVAALAVGKERLTDLAPKVRPLLKDSSNHVRVSAIFALVQCGQDVDQTPLAAYLLEDPSPLVNRNAAYVLGELGNPTALPLLQNAVRVRAARVAPSQQRILQLQLAEAMIKLGDVTQKAVIRAALYPSQPEDLESAALAVQILAQLNDRESIGQLVNLAAYRDRAGQRYPAEVRLGIAAALARMGMDGAVGIADEFWQDKFEPLRAQTAFAYGELGEGKRLDRLEIMVTDASPMVQVSAAAAILRTSTP